MFFRVVGFFLVQ